MKIRYDDPKLIYYAKHPTYNGWEPVHASLSYLILSGLHLKKYKKHVITSKKWKYTVSKTIELYTMSGSVNKPETYMIYRPGLYGYNFSCFFTEIDNLCEGHWSLFLGDFCFTNETDATLVENFLE